MIIVPDDPGFATSEEVLEARVVRVFDGDGFLANVWHPERCTWVNSIPFRANLSIFGVANFVWP